MATILARGLVGLLLTSHTFASLPYNAAEIFIPSRYNGSLAYILQPQSSSSNQFELVSLNISKTVDTSNPQYSPISSVLPFQDQDDGNGKSFSAAIDDAGVILFYTGNCNDESSGDLWRFVPDNTTAAGNGTWSQGESINLAGDTEPSTADRPSFLASAVSFSPNNDSSLYVFGGMCPTTVQTGQDWVSAANYSQSMLSLEPESSSSTAYQLQQVGTRGPPVAEAGFKMTPLQATYSETGTGSHVQQAFALVGGHTQNAFINMSQIALFSLPQTSWSYVSVSQPTDQSTTELARMDTTEVEPRSGHTAVLTSDGSKIIVFGGWVGNSSTAAKPQLAILEVGDDYGGSGEWAWTVPSQTSSWLDEGSGIFGHGAAMLPGDVMMVVGGYEISGSSKRSTSGNAQMRLFNTTSNSWMSSYANPNHQSQGQDAQADSHGPLSSKGQKIGLGAGLGVGLAAVVILLILAVLYRRRFNQHRKTREKNIRSLAMGAEIPNFWVEPEMTETYDGSPMHLRGGRVSSTVPDDPYLSNLHGGPAWLGNSASEAERTGLLVDVPSPTRGLRKNLSGRNQSYTPQFHNVRRPHSGVIHPIDEQEEDGELVVDNVPALATKFDQRDSYASGASDPFGDHKQLMSDPLMSAFGSEKAPSEADRASPGEKDAHRALALETGEALACEERPLSQGQSDRTISNLSEKSSTSGVSASSIQRSLTDSPDRSESLASGYRPVGMSPSPESSRGSSPEAYAKNHTSSSSGVTNLTRLFDRTAESAETFSTAHTSFPKLQAEGELLLGGGPDWSTPPESPTKSPVVSKQRSMGWMGSVRRALSVVRPAESRGESHSDAPRHSAIDHARTSTPKPDRLRRASTVNAAALERKQGAKDWDAATNRWSSASTQGLLKGRAVESPASWAYDDITTADRHDEFDDDEEWDVEAAAERRTVQVTFTVPKERLRVVNPGHESTEDDEEDALDMSGKGKQIAR